MKPFTPPSIDKVSILTTRLGVEFVERGVTLSIEEARHLTANLFAHSDWAVLREAIDAGPPSPVDDDVFPADRRDRLKHQQAVLRAFGLSAIEADLLLLSLKPTSHSSLGSARAAEAIERRVDVLNRALGLGDWISVNLEATSLLEEAPDDLKPRVVALMQEAGKIIDLCWSRLEGDAGAYDLDDVVRELKAIVKRRSRRDEIDDEKGEACAMLGDISAGRYGGPVDMEAAIRFYRRGAERFLSCDCEERLARQRIASGDLAGGMRDLLEASRSRDEMTLEIAREIRSGALPGALEQLKDHVAFGLGFCMDERPSVHAISPDAGTMCASIDGSTGPVGPWRWLQSLHEYGWTIADGNDEAGHDGAYFGVAISETERKPSVPMFITGESMDLLHTDAIACHMRELDRFESVILISSQISGYSHPPIDDDDFEELTTEHFTRHGLDVPENFEELAEIPVSVQQPDDTGTFCIGAFKLNGGWQPLYLSPGGLDAAIGQHALLARGDIDPAVAFGLPEPDEVLARLNDFTGELPAFGASPGMRLN